MPSRVHVWRTRKSGEIDFVCGPHDRLSAVEVKYGRTRIGERQRASRAHSQAVPPPW